MSQIGDLTALGAWSMISLDRGKRLTLKSTSSTLVFRREN
jgi:hypothetical protein